MFTFEELYANFNAFIEIFNNASHAPFMSADIDFPIQPGQEKGRIRDIQRRRLRGKPPVYLDPGFIAKIILNTSRDDPNMWDKEYIFLITPEGGISFKGKFVFSMQPKMKWLETCPSASQIRM
jgi:hypothetical protein